MKRQFLIPYMTYKCVNGQGQNTGIRVVWFVKQILFLCFVGGSYFVHWLP